MKNYFLILIAMLAVIITSCQKDKNDPQPNPDYTSIKDLVVRPSFDWKTTHQVSLKLTGYANSTCTISYANGTLIQKVFLKKNEPFILKINIPTAEKKLQLEYMGQKVELEITGTEINYMFN